MHIYCVYKWESGAFALYENQLHSKRYVPTTGFYILKVGIF